MEAGIKQRSGLRHTGLGMYKKSNTPPSPPARPFGLGLIDIAFNRVPKELIARFVRYCPSCSLRRSAPSKARQQKIKREEEDDQYPMQRTGNYHPTTPPSPPSPPAREHKMHLEAPHHHQQQHHHHHHHQDYSYPTPANSPQDTTTAAYANAASAASHPAHLMMPVAQITPDPQWPTAYWEPAASYE